MNIIIRNENESDIEAISEITKEAFLSLPISNHTEQFIIKALRKANALTISLVVEKEKKVMREFQGHNTCDEIYLFRSQKLPNN